jgi:hypothetical protein
MIISTSHSDQAPQVKAVPPSVHVFVTPVVREIPPRPSEPASFARVW